MWRYIKKPGDENDENDDLNKNFFLPPKVRVCYYFLSTIFLVPNTDQSLRTYNFERFIQICGNAVGNRYQTLLQGNKLQIFL